MLKKSTFCIIVVVCLLCMCAISASAGTLTLEQAVAQSDLRDYVLIEKAEGQELSAAIGVNADGDRVLIAAEYGAPIQEWWDRSSPSACFERMIPESVDTEELSVEIDEDPNRYPIVTLYMKKGKQKDKAFVKFMYHPENGWVFYSLAGEYEGVQYTVMEALPIEGERDAQNELDVSEDGTILERIIMSYWDHEPASFSYEKTLQRAAELYHEGTATRLNRWIPYVFLP